MGIAADILALRERHFSSVALLLNALEQVCDAPPWKISARVFLAGEAANLVLTNVAAHAEEAFSELQLPTNRKTRRVVRSRRKYRRSDHGLPPQRQRMLFAASSTATSSVPN